MRTTDAALPPSVKAFLISQSIPSMVSRVPTLGSMLTHSANLATPTLTAVSWEMWNGRQERLESRDSCLLPNIPDNPPSTVEVLKLLSGKFAVGVV